MTWTKQHDLAIAQRLMGYPCHVSPLGHWYIHDGDDYRPLPDYQTDGTELLLALEGWILMTKGNRTVLLMNIGPRIVMAALTPHAHIGGGDSFVKSGPSGQIIRNLAWALYRAVAE